MKWQLGDSRAFVLTHPRQREGQESWKDDVERTVLTAEHQ